MIAEMNPLALLGRFPAKLLVATVIAFQSIGEFFPVSRFPMYAETRKSTWYVYVTDGADQPVPVQRHFRLSAGFLRKVFKERRDAIRERIGEDKEFLAEAERRAGLETLQYLVANPKAKQRWVAQHTALRLHKVEVSIVGENILRVPSLVAEYRAE